MTDNEAYRIGGQLGHQLPPVPRGITIAQQVAHAPLPPGVLPDTTQAKAFRLGYHDGLRGRRVLIKGG